MTSEQIEALSEAASEVNAVAISLAITNKVPADVKTCADRLSQALVLIAAGHNQLRCEMKPNLRRI
jgi:hypothetical protein